MLIDKINELKDLTLQEQAVVDYINNHPKAIIEMNIQQLAQVSFTSSSTIIRLCKKIDLKGYSELRFMYALDFSEMMQQRKKVKRQPFEKDSTIDDIIEVIPLIYFKTINYTKTMLSRNKIIRITNLMKQAKRIEIYGNGVNYDLGKMMAFHFEGVHKDCFVYNASHWEHIKELEHEKIPTLAIILSHYRKKSNGGRCSKTIKRMPC